MYASERKIKASEHCQFTSQLKMKKTVMERTTCGSIRNGHFGKGSVVEKAKETAARAMGAREQGQSKWKISAEDCIYADRGAQ